MASTAEKATAELEDLVKVFIEYWNCEDTLKIEENFLARLLHSKVKRKKECLVPTTHELLAMVDHIEVIFKRYTHKDNKYTKGDKGTLRKFFNLHLAFLLGLSEGALQTLRHGTLEDINYYLDNCYAFLRQFLSGYDPRTMGLNKKRPAPSESDEKSSKIVKLDEAGAKSATEAGCSGAKSETEAGPPSDPKSTKKEGTRDRQLPDKVKSRDKGRCVVSGIGFGVEAAHVMAHTASNTSEAHGQQMLHWRIAELMFGSHLSDRLRQLFDEPNAAEQDWNLITLAAHIHFALDNGLVAFQPLPDAEPRSSILQFRLQWFDQGRPKNFHTKKITPTTKSIEAMYSPLQNEQAIGRDVDMRTGRLILTDNVYEVEFALEDIESRDKMKFAMDARWKIQKFMFLAGAAGMTAEQFRPLEDDEDVDAVESDAHFELVFGAVDPDNSNTSP